MKKILAVLFALLCICSFAGAEKTDTDDKKYISGDYTYVILENGTAEIIGYTGNAEILELPSELDGIPVTDIGDSAFSGCSSLFDVTIPDGIKCIGKWAFAGCDLTDVIIPNSVVFIGYGAFRSCEKLEKAVIGDHVAIIGDEAFNDCPSLREIRMPDSMLCLGNSVFRGCSALIAIDLPTGISYIGSETFKDCSSLVSVSIPDSVAYIGEEAFSACSSLTDITIPDSVTEIYAYAFVDCSSLTEITIPGSVSYIGRGAFCRCFSLTEITIPGSVSSLGIEAFGRCSSLTEITIQDGVTYVGSNSFERCPSLTTVNLPDSLIIFELDAFNNCNALESIMIPKSVIKIQRYFFKWNDAFTVHAAHGSYAALYCINNGIPLEYLEEEEKVISISEMLGYHTSLYGRWLVRQEVTTHASSDSPEDKYDFEDGAWIILSIEGENKDDNPFSVILNRGGTVRLIFENGMCNFVGSGINKGSFPVYYDEIEYVINDYEIVFSMNGFTYTAYSPKQFEQYDDVTVIEHEETDEDDDEDDDDIEF